MGCHFLLQFMKVKSENEVAHSCPTLGDPMDCSLPGSSIHVIFQARVLAVAGALSMAKSYRTSEVRGSGLECQAVTAQEWSRGATRHLKPGAAPEAKGGSRKEQPHVQG